MVSRYLNPQTFPEKVFRGSKHLTRYLWIFGCLGQICLVDVGEFRPGKSGRLAPETFRHCLDFCFLGPCLFVKHAAEQNNIEWGNICIHHILLQRLDWDSEYL